MTENKQLKYSFTIGDIVEAKHLDRTSAKNSFYGSWIYILFVIFFIALGIVDLTKIEPEDLAIISYLKELFVSDEIVTNNLASAIWNFLLAFILSFNVTPKYNLLSRWIIARKYRKNFMQQEPKTLNINSDLIELVSENHRRSMQRQDFSHFQENKQIYLLHGSQVKMIIPKRAIDSAELANITSLFNSKIN
ncbi:MAG: hypothetical protein ACFCAD_08455 [Pleurocapsa sp.]